MDLDTDAPPSPATAGEKRKREEDEDEEEKNNKQEKKQQHPLWKTSLCSYYRRTGASCSHGDACKYAHGEAELRSRPDNTWDPTSWRAKKNNLEGGDGDGKAPATKMEEVVTVDEHSLDKCLIGVPRKWLSDKLKTFLDDQGISCSKVRKKKGMPVGFVSFDNVEQLKTAIEVLNENALGGKEIKIADTTRKSDEKKRAAGIPSSNVVATQNDGAAPAGETSVVEGSKRSVRDVVTPLAHMPYNEQLEQKKNSLLQTLKRLTRNARKACPDALPLPEWILKSREIGGLPCKLEGILESPVVNGYRNKCEFSVGYSLDCKKTVGFMLGNFRDGVTAVEQPVDCPNVSGISCKYALIFQDFIESSPLPLWNRIDNTGFWRQFTVREGRKQDEAVVGDLETQITEVMLIVQVCSSDVDDAIMKDEFDRLCTALAQGAAACSPPLPLTTVVVQDHKGISNAAAADCPLLPLLAPKVDSQSCSENQYSENARIHDYIGKLRFSISPTAFFQVNTLAAERLYKLAGDWADLNSDTLLFDICCGTGTIGLTLSDRVGMVVGIEMNESAVSDAERNAVINGVKNCRFVCGKAEDVIGSLLTEYLGAPKPDNRISNTVPNTNGTDKNDKALANTEKVDSSTMDGKSGEINQNNAGAFGDDRACANDNEMVEDTTSKILESDLEECQDTDKPDSSERSLIESISVDDATISPGCITDKASSPQESSERSEKCQDDPLSDNKGTNGSTFCQFKNVVALVDPPRVGLHPVVIKALRTHPRIRRLVYISCNPESLVANAIELCTPTVDKPEKSKGHRGWRNMSSAGLARQRTKSMPNSEPFRPVTSMAVDLFPHTPHCEMVMLFER